VGKIFVKLRGIDAQTLFQFLLGMNAGVDGLASDGSDRQTEGTAVNGDRFGIHHFETMPKEQGLDGCQGKIKDVFMIDGVEFRVFDERDCLGKLEDDPAVRFDESGETGNEVIGSGDMSEDIVAKDQV